MRTLNPMSRHRRRCAEVRGQMSEYLDGDLDEREVRRFERHMRYCMNCRRMRESLRRTVAGLQRLNSEGEPKAGPAQG